MRRIQVTDCRTLAFPPAQVFAAVADLKNYPRWWPAELKVRLLTITPEGIGSRLEVHPHHGLLVCEVTRIVANTEIHIQYVEGVQRGTGVWTVEPNDEGTRLCPRHPSIAALPKHPLLRIIPPGHRQPLPRPQRPASGERR